MKPKELIGMTRCTTRNVRTGDIYDCHCQWPLGHTHARAVSLKYGKTRVKGEGHQELD